MRYGQASTLLVVAAHPDDEVLGCGATVARLKREGWRAVLVLMTRGIGGRAQTAAAFTEAHNDAQNTLAVQSERAAEIIGFDRVIRHDFPDNRMDTVARADLAHDLLSAIEQERPVLVLTHHPGDYNWDHCATFDAVLMAARTSPGDPSPDEIWSFEVASSSERGWRGRAAPFSPTVYVNVTDTIDIKKQALAAYVDELRPHPHPRSIQSVEVLARKRGYEVGMNFAECFEMVRKVIQ